MATTKRTRRSQLPEALTMLREDHRKVEGMIKEFEHASDDDEREMIVRTVCNELTLHTMLEEQVFYPALRQELDDTDLLDEAAVEHNTAKNLINQLQEMHASDALYIATFTVLGEYVQHHVREEEKEMFPMAQDTGLDFDALAAEMIQRREELRVELGLPDAESIPPPQGRRGRPAQRGRNSRAHH